ncbi:MAG: FkbM family methyltransferase [Magnetococcales bacterium]|nr:FkbM family methyltransferase [Magnetococcales bacterium]
MTLEELIGEAGRALAAGRIEEALRLYREWLAVHGASHPMAHLILFNYGTTLMGQGDAAGARDALQAALRLRPDMAQAGINLGSVLERLGDADAAAACWREVAEGYPGVTGETIRLKREACRKIAAMADPVTAEAALRAALDIDPRAPELVAEWLDLRRERCLWPIVEPLGGLDRATLMAGFSPHGLAACHDDPMWQLANAARYWQAVAGRPESLAVDTRGGIRPAVGYLCAMDPAPAGACGLAELLECHDRAKVALFVYAFGPDRADPAWERIRIGVEHWRDLAGLGDAEAARRIVADRVEILIDVTGHAPCARPGVAAMRPAPVLVNWSACPGSMGTPWHHYLLADSFVVPPEHEVFCTERVERLPVCLPFDRRAGEGGITRREAGLPEGVVVLGVFPGAGRITPEVWRAWMTILQRAPASLLWLPGVDAELAGRLRVEAGAAGIDPERLVATPGADVNFGSVDLWLDTFPLSAGPLVARALWQGVPVVTRYGLTAASRVGAAVLRGMGLEELARGSWEEYVALAVALANQPRPWRIAPDRAPPFDTPALVGALERLYDRLLAALREGKTPRPDPAGLDLYQRIGVALALAGQTPASLEELTRLWRERLTALDRLEKIPPGRFPPPAVAPEPSAAVARFLELDLREDQRALLDHAQDATVAPGERIAALEALLARNRFPSAFVLAMVCANAGHGNLAIAVALAIGGLVFGNQQEAERGLEMLRREAATRAPLPLGCREAGMLAETVRFLEAMAVGAADRERYHPVWELFAILAPEIFARRAPGGEPVSFVALAREMAPIKVVDVGSGPELDKPPFYHPLREVGVEVIGFEPNPGEARKLAGQQRQDEIFLPLAIGDGGRHTLHYCFSPGMSSLLAPDPEVLGLFHGFPEWGRVMKTAPIDTVRLDDVPETAGAMFLKLDVQGAEGMVLDHAPLRLAEAVVVQTEVEFLPMYAGQPLFSEVEQRLRAHGYMLHRFHPLTSRVVRPLRGANLYAGMSQLVWADAVFVRDLTRLERLTDRQLVVMAAILHYCYGSHDVVVHLLTEYERRSGRAAGADYLALIRHQGA